MYHGGPTPEQIYTSLRPLGAELVTIYVKPPHPNVAKLFDGWVGHHGPAIEVPTPADMVSTAIEYARHTPFDGMLALPETLVSKAAMIGEALGLRANSPAVAEYSQNKLLQRQALAAANVPSPKFFAIQSKSDLQAAAAHTGFPAVLKPAYGAGSYHVYAVEHYQELEDAYTLASESYVNRLAEISVPTFLLEERLIGVDWHNDPRLGDYGSVESVIIDGHVHHLVVTDRLPLVEPFRETGSIMPSSLPEALQAQMKQVAEQAIKAVGLRWGAAHTELKYTERGPQVIEVNARPGGPMCELLKRAADYDLIYQMGRMALGLEPSLDIQFKQGAGLVGVYPPRYAVRLVDVRGADVVAQLPGVDQMVVAQPVGTVLLPSMGSSHIAGFAFFHAPDFEACVRLQAEIVSLLEFVYEPIDDVVGT
jgi:hypothetical protein